MMHEFIEFEEIRKTMEYYQYNYLKDSESVREKLLERKKGKVYSINEHLEALVFAELSNQRPWKQIAENSQKIREIFHYFDAEYIKNENPQVFLDAILSISCGNRQIRKQIYTLKDNILTLERIAKENGSIDEYYNKTDIQTLIKELSQGKYKLKQMGAPLVSEYLKGMGLDVIKPDVHVCRILGRLGYTEHCPATEKEAYEVCDRIAKSLKTTNIEVDSTLWQYCANGYFSCCSEKPNCKKCFVTNCKYKNNC